MPRAIQTCDTCGIAFRPKHTLRPNQHRHFCSIECRNNQGNSDAEMRCAKCGKPFLLKRCKLGLYNRFYCSHACQNADRGDLLRSLGKRGVNWKGGESLTIDGRTRLYLPDHPNADAKGYILRARFVASQKLGRPLREGEHVHHVNCDRTDDRPENLEVMSHSEHARLHGRLRSEAKAKREQTV